MGVIYSGLDWSGSPGNRQPIVFAIVHVDYAEIRELDRALDVARRTLRLPDRFIFRHVSCSQQAHRAFYDAIVHLPFSAHIYEAAPTSPGQPVDGFGELRRAIETIALGCPEMVVANQKLYIDLERRDLRLVRQLRTSVRQALRGVGRETFANMQPCPDHRIEGGIVQIADMLAGEYREQRGLDGPYLPRIQTRITVL